MFGRHVTGSSNSSPAKDDIFVNPTMNVILTFIGSSTCTLLLSTRYGILSRISLSYHISARCWNTHQHYSEIPSISVSSKWSFFADISINILYGISHLHQGCYCLELSFLTLRNPSQAQFLSPELQVSHIPSSLITRNKRPVVTESEQRRVHRATKCWQRATLFWNLNYARICNFVKCVHKKEHFVFFFRSVRC